MAIVGFLIASIFCTLLPQNICQFYYFKLTCYSVLSEVICAHQSRRETLAWQTERNTSSGGPEKTAGSKVPKKRCASPTQAGTLPLTTRRSGCPGQFASPSPQTNTAISGFTFLAGSSKKAATITIESARLIGAKTESATWSPFNNAEAPRLRLSSQSGRFCYMCLLIRRPST